MEKHISIVIPNFNMASTLSLCLEAAFASVYTNFEVIVVDDHSDDNSPEIIRKFPCKLVSLEKRSGTSAARNAGARMSRGDVVFFIDADCLVQPDTLSIINRTLPGDTSGTVIGGTYTAVAYDDTFFSTFQSAWVHYSETRKPESPDYIAAHAMIIERKAFDNGGFPEDFLPIIEDVEFSHRLRRAGYKLMVNPDIQVRHIFGFSFIKSLRNAFHKTMYWCMYSLGNRDLFSDSGTASLEFKTNVVLCFLNLLLIASAAAMKKPELLYPVPLIIIAGLFMSRRLIRVFYKAKGGLFAFLAFSYYSMVYPLPIGIGTAAGMIKYIMNRQKQ